MNHVLITLVYLGVSVAAYALMGGADFGMGLLELFFKDKKEKIQTLTKTAIGPVWEANHVWLIVTIVILFVGFPQTFSVICTHLHLPLFLLLLGIVIRGTSFSFRHYDPIKDKSHEIHSLFFNWSSLLTPMILGMIFAAMLTVFPVSGSYVEMYIKPWVSGFTIVTGLFFVSLCLLNAITFSVFEKYGDSVDLDPLFKKVWWTTVILADVTAAVGYFDHLIFTRLNGELVGIWAVGFVAFVSLYFAVVRRKRWVAYVSSAVAMISLLAGVVLSRFPVSIANTEQQYTWFNDNTHDLSLIVLNSTLTLGLLIIIPFLIYLFVLFKGSE